MSPTIEALRLQAFEGKPTEGLKDNNAKNKQDSLFAISDVLEKVDSQKYKLLLKNPLKYYGFKDHNLKDYVSAFKFFNKYNAVKFLGIGSNSVVLELEDEKVLKISNKLPYKDTGKRPFDVPLLDQDELTTEHTGRDGKRYPIKVYYIVQPKVKKDGVTIKDLKKMKEEVEKQGYIFWDCRLSQIGIYQGKVVLIDSDSVKRREEAGLLEKTGEKLSKYILFPYEKAKEKMRSLWHNRWPITRFHTSNAS